MIRHLTGDCRAILPTLPAESVHCCITSPPYYALRDYQVTGQIGLEATPEAYVAELVGVFREVRRVLRRDGTLWLNLGDLYAGNGTNRNGLGNSVIGSGPNGACKQRDIAGAVRSSVPAGLKPKDMLGIPWMVAFALRADGWYLRSDIIWSKPNPMPESVTDRPTKAHEYLFLLSRSPKYYYDAEAIAEVAAWPEGPWGGRNPRPGIDLSGNQSTNVAIGTGGSQTRNRRSVWTVATAPFRQDHFAVFPPALIEPCIKAGVPERCCAKCGAPWVREVADSAAYADFKAAERTRKSGGMRSNDLETLGLTRGTSNKSISAERITLGFSPSCACEAGTVPGTVLDPFGGAGTTGLVADRLQRNAILIELSDAYASMAETRISDDRGPLLALMEGP